MPPTVDVSPCHAAGTGPTRVDATRNTDTGPARNAVARCRRRLDYSGRRHENTDAGQRNPMPRRSTGPIRSTPPEHRRRSARNARAIRRHKHRIPSRQRHKRHRRRSRVELRRPMEQRRQCREERRRRSRAEHQRWSSPELQLRLIRATSSGANALKRLNAWRRPSSV